MKWLTAVLLAIAAVLAGLLVYRSVVPPALSGGTAIDTPVALPDLKLVNDQGKDTTLAASDGRMRLIFYGFVHCPDVCPTTLASLKNTYAGLTPEQQGKVRVQFISVDPVVDTPNLVRQYLDRFDPQFTGLTGSVENINAAAKTMFVGIVNNRPSDHTGTDHSAHTAPEPATANAGNTGLGASEAAIIHGDQVSVITPDGKFVRVYNNTEALDGTLKHDLPELIREFGS